MLDNRIKDKPVEKDDSQIDDYESKAEIDQQLVWRVTIQGRNKKKVSKL